MLLLISTFFFLIFSICLSISESISKNSISVEKILNSKQIDIKDRERIGQGYISKWVKSFCAKRGNEYYIEVPLPFLHDPVVLNSISILYDSIYSDDAIKLMTDNLLPDEFSKARYRNLEHVTIDLYNIFHSRYLLTWEGLSAVKSKYNNGVYGHCPRYYCNGQNLLPVGLDDETGKSTVKCFCPKCEDVFHPFPVLYRKIDSCAFGTTFPHLLMMQFPEMKIKNKNMKYVPKVFGFTIKDS